MVSALFCRADSNYFDIQNVDVWTAERNARKWPGGGQVIAHPPCRQWGRLRHFACGDEYEKQHALWSVEQVREWGGVLEHPAWSSLWRSAKLPLPGRKKDAFGGWTLPVNQNWWGHRAEKATWLYIVGVEPAQIPVLPFRLGEATHVIATNTRNVPGRQRPEVTKAEREHTPPAFAEWLVELAGQCHA